MINMPQNNIENLAQTFSKILLQWLGQDKIDAINAENALRNDTSCASHDHCDPNQAMIDAYAVVFGREPFNDDDQEQSDLDTDRINEAWNLSKKNKFQFNPNL